MNRSLPAIYSIYKWQRLVAVFILLTALGSITALPAASSPLNTQAPGQPLLIYLPITMNNYEPPPPPTSFELIDTALQDGKISTEIALEYKVFAIFDDARLPAAYRGGVVGGESGLFMNEVVAAYPTLSSTAKAVVAPFFIPPFQSGSWTTQAKGVLAPTAPTDWSYITAASGKARVWYPKTNADLQRKAGVIANALSNDIWNSETKLMQKSPVYDAAGVQNFVVFDHYRKGWNSSFVPFGGYAGMTVPQTCSQTASIIYINPDLPDTGNSTTTGLVETTAHEFMHALQFAFPLAVDPCSEYGWMAEATATWAEDFVYGSHNTEWRLAKNYLNTSYMGYTNRYNFRDYGQYLLVYWTTHYYKDDDAVRRAWVSAGSVDSVKSFAAFGNLNYMQLAALWNKEPFDTFFKDSEGLDYQVKSDIDDTLKATGGFKEYELWDYLKGGGARFFHFKVDPSVRTITFLDGLSHKIVKGPAGTTGDFVYNQEDLTLDEKRGADVVTMVKYEGLDQPYVLTNPARWDICQDWLKQKVTEIIVILANNDTQDRYRELRGTGLKTRIMVSSTPCMKLTGTATRTDTGTGSVKETLTATGLEYNYLIYNTIVNLDPRYINLLDPDIDMKLIKGTVNWQISGTDVSECTHSGSQTFTIGPDNGAMLQLEYQLLPDSKHYMGYTGNAGLATGEQVTETIQCPNQSPPPHSYDPGDFFPNTFGEIPVGPDGSLSGSITYDQGSGISTTYEWNFTPSTLP